MSNTKKARENQIYENYWSLTLEYTDFSDEKFNKTLMETYHQKYIKIYKKS